jgi:hypothetical protein
MNRGRLRRYALRVVAALALGLGVAVVAGGVANATTVQPIYGKLIPSQEQEAGVSADETTWG